MCVTIYIHTHICIHIYIYIFNSLHTLPPLCTAMRSAFWIVLSLCATTRVVLLFIDRSWSNASCTTRSDSASRADVASSEGWGVHY